MPEIRVLPEKVWNRIAAGEILERPANAVKELVENAIDASAGRVEVEISEGGRSLIRVIDDGEGIPSRELALAVRPHATSKIRDADDLFHILTKGFRGEALSSIAAVSRLEIASSTGGAGASGHALSVAGGEAGGEEPRARARGTTVAVRDLFFNTPARRKFLKSPQAEAAAVHRLLACLSLAHPEVSFRLQSNGKEVFDLPAVADVRARIGDLFGRETREALLPVEYRAEAGLAVSGFIARPPESQANARGIHVFLNRRWILHPPLVHVVRQGFEGALPPRRYPVAFIFLAVDPGRVDVNVHPTKQEVRFEEERKVLGSVHRAVAQALRGEAAPPAPSPPEGKEGRGADASAGRGGRTESLRERQKAAEAAPAYVPTAEIPSRKHPSMRFARRYDVPVRLSRPPAEGEALPAGDAPVPGDTIIIVEGEALPAGDAPARTAQGRVFSEAELPRRPLYRVLGQAHGRVLCVECEAGVMLIDQHALHERLLYEELRSASGPVFSQKLLVPAVVELRPDEWAVFHELEGELARMGFQAEPFGERTIAIQAAPAALAGVRLGPLLRDTLAELAGGKVPTRELAEPFLKTLACRAAVKAGERLPEGAVVALLERLEEERTPLTCPHGRPISLTLTIEDLNRRFGRT
ncbi:MAG: DNA mismatch repair endonuclease MutL [Planctomycetota bacterium]